MGALVIAVAVVLSGADSLSAARVGGLSLKAPSEWAASDVDNGKSWAEKGDGAQLELAVWDVDPKRKGQECLDQLLEKVGAEGWAPQKVAKEPAVRKVTMDFVGDEDAGKTDANKVSTVSLMGCNGSTKWLLTMTSKASAAPRYGALLKRIVDSIAYGK